VASSAAGAAVHPPAAPEAKQTCRSVQTPSGGPRSLLAPEPQREVAQCHGGGAVWDRQSLRYNRPALGCAGVAPVSPPSDGACPENRARGCEGGRAAWEPSGAQTRRAPRPRPRPRALALLPSPLWPSPQPDRRRLACEEGGHGCWPRFWRSSPALPTHPPRAQGASRAPHVGVSLVAYAASDFAGPAPVYR
jgi:hypothetical protein